MAVVKWTNKHACRFCGDICHSDLSCKRKKTLIANNKTHYNNNRTHQKYQQLCKKCKGVYHAHDCQNDVKCGRCGFSHAGVNYLCPVLITYSLTHLLTYSL